MTFKQWLEGHVSDGNLIGNIARDVMADGDCWTPTNTYRAAKNHITREHRASFVAQVAMWRAWNAYDAERMAIPA